MGDLRARQHGEALLAISLKARELEAREPVDIVRNTQRRKGIEVIGDRNHATPNQGAANSRSQQNENDKPAEDDR
jgi:hypothetical protein